MRRQSAARPRSRQSRAGHYLVHSFQPPPPPPRPAPHRAHAAAATERSPWDGRTRLPIADLASAGAFLRCADPLAIGRYVTMRLRLPTGRAFTVLGRVVRQVRSQAHDLHGCGMGLRFIDLAHRDRRAIADFVAAHA